MEHWAKTIAKNGGVAAVTIQEGADRLRELQARAEEAEKQFKILNETMQHVTVMYDNAMVRAEKAEAALDSMTTELGKMFLSAAERADRNVELRRRAEKAEGNVEQLTKHCSALEVEVAVLSEGLSEDHAIYIANARAEKAEAQLHDLNLDLLTANHMIKLERDRADALQTRLNEIDAMLKSPDLID
jgi:DNA repair exonuclease SbcCD ATPase subunit